MYICEAKCEFEMKKLTSYTNLIQRMPNFHPSLIISCSKVESWRQYDPLNSSEELYLLLILKQDDMSHQKNCKRQQPVRSSEYAMKYNQ